MKKNVGKTDRILRILFGLIIISAGLYAKSWFGLIGLIPLTTAFIGWCPAYVPFGLSSCKLKGKNES